MRPNLTSPPRSSKLPSDGRAVWLSCSGVSYKVSLSASSEGNVVQVGQSPSFSPVPGSDSVALLAPDGKSYTLGLASDSGNVVVDIPRLSQSQSTRRAIALVSPEGVVKSLGVALDGGNPTYQLT